MLKIVSFFNLLFPSVNNIPRSWNQYLESLGIAGLCIYTFAFPFSKDICYIGEWVMVGAFILSVPYIWPKMKHDPVWLAFLVLFAYLVFKGILTFLVYEEPVVDILNAIRYRLRFLWIFIIAWWLGGDRVSLLRLLTISLFGFFLLLFIGFEIRMLAVFEQEMRVGFGLNSQIFALFAATALCGTLFLAKDFWGDRNRHFRIVIWALLVFLFIELSILSQTRTIWIALMAVLVFSSVSFVALMKYHQIKVRATGLAYGVFLLVIIVPIIFFHHGAMQKRTSSELPELKQMLFWNWEDIGTSSSIGKRFALWEWSVDKIKQRPLVGWKINNTSKGYIERSENIDEAVAHFNHVHNGYLEILLNQGLIGFAIFLFFPLYVIGSVFRLFKRKILSFRFFMTFCSIVILFGVANITVEYIATWEGWPYFSIFFGGFYSIALWSRQSVKGSTHNKYV